IANLGPRGVTNCYGRKAASLDLEDGCVGFRVSGDNASLKFPLLRKSDTYFCRAIDYVIVGEDVTFRANDNAGAQILLTMIPRLRQSKVFIAIALAAKELPKERHHPFRGLRARSDNPG